jgi:Cys-tRNA(Pro)/Cys-tRNA(Cys) deacylase
VEPQAKIPRVGSFAARLGLLDVQLLRMLAFNSDSAGQLGGKNAGRLGAFKSLTSQHVCSWRHGGLRSFFAMKTRAAQVLDKLGIPYEIREFQEEELNADEVAEKLHIPLARVFKTLVVRGDRTGVILACLPGTTTLSLKGMAKESGNRRVEMVEKDEIHRLTGYLRGGVSPLGGKKSYAVYLDRSALEQPIVSVSAGMRGMLLFLKPQDLVRAAKAKVAVIGTGDEK